MIITSATPRYMLQLQAKQSERVTLRGKERQERWHRCCCCFSRTNIIAAPLFCLPAPAEGNTFFFFSIHIMFFFFSLFRCRRSLILRRCSSSIDFIRMNNHYGHTPPPSPFLLYSFDIFTYDIFRHAAPVRYLLRVPPAGVIAAVQQRERKKSMRSDARYRRWRVMKRGTTLPRATLLPRAQARRRVVYARYAMLS